MMLAILVRELRSIKEGRKEEEKRNSSKVGGEKKERESKRIFVELLFYWMAVPKIISQDLW